MFLLLQGGIGAVLLESHLMAGTGHYQNLLMIADISVAAGWDWCCAAGESPDGGNRSLPEPTDDC